MRWLSFAETDQIAAASPNAPSVDNMRFLKKLMVVLAMLALGLAGGGLVGFALGYIIAGDGRSNIHGGAILVGLLTIGGAVAGLIVGSVTADRVARRVT